ncbi:hypothetical protein BVY01_04680, partial [bacterium I07]
IIQWHPAWDYFAHDYGLNISGTVGQGHGDMPSIKHFQDLIRKGREQNVRGIVIGLHIQSSSADALSRELGVPLLHLDAIGTPENPAMDTYIEMMKHNAQYLARELE